MGCHYSKTSHSSAQPRTKKPTTTVCFGKKKVDNDDVSSVDSLSTTEDDKLINKLPMDTSPYCSTNAMTFPRPGYDQSVNYGIGRYGPGILMHDIGKMESKLLAYNDAMEYDKKYMLIVLDRELENLELHARFGYELCEKYIIRTMERNKQIGRSIRTADDSYFIKNKLSKEEAREYLIKHHTPFRWETKNENIHELVDDVIVVPYVDEEYGWLFHDVLDANPKKELERNHKVIRELKQLKHHFGIADMKAKSLQWVIHEVFDPTLSKNKKHMTHTNKPKKRWLKSISKANYQKLKSTDLNSFPKYDNIKAFRHLYM